MNSSCIAVVDDDPRISRLVKSHLERDGYRVVTAADGPGAIDLVESHDPDLLLLDIMLPGMDGCEVLRRIREFSALPVIMVTAKGDEADIVRGLETGADDYLTKPFNEKELIARVHAVLRRTHFGPEDKRAAVFVNGKLAIDYGQHIVKLDDEEVPLTPTEYRLLACLAQSVGRTLLQEDILLKVWGTGYEGEAHLLRVNVARLRGKLGEDANSARYVVTRPGVGYMMPQGDATEAE
ncbi:MAG: response regulator transcription factor [Chloroflexi bacterium]|nr:response regulator transcription factor [Chloroflexota bacterium]